MAEKVAQKKTVAKKAPAKRVAKAKTKAPAGELSAVLYSATGKEAGKVALPASVFGVQWNADLVHQVALGMEANARAGRGRAHTKNRGDVRGGGKKPWRQKGTGRARHGSSRSPIWRGGGVTHGPRAEKEYSVRIPKKMRVHALFSVLSRKLADGEVLFVDALPMQAPKTADAKNTINALATIAGFEKIARTSGNAVLVVTPARNEAVMKSFRNIGTADVEEVRNLNVVDALAFTHVVIVDPDTSVPVLASKLN